MALSIYQASVPVFAQMLSALAGVLEKAEAHARDKRIEPTVLLDDRLYPDMWPLLRQVRVACDFARGACARLAGVESPSYEDKENSFGELQSRIAKTLEFLQSLKPAQFDGSEDREITVKLGQRSVTFEGQHYLLRFVLPNFCFHCTTAYAILRHNGVELAKRDFLGKVPGM